MATGDNRVRYREHLLRLLERLRHIDRSEIVTLICKAGKHRSLSLAALTWHLTHVQLTENRRKTCEHRHPCARIDPAGAVAILRMLV